MRSKALCERAHLRRRSLQRYGKRFGRDTVARWVNDIHAGRAVFLHRTSNARTNWAVRHEGQWIPVVYNRTTKQIITVLPAKVLDEHKDKLPT